MLRVLSFGFVKWSLNFVRDDFENDLVCFRVAAVFLIASELPDRKIAGYMTIIASDFKNN